MIRGRLLPALWPALFGAGLLAFGRPLGGAALLGLALLLVAVPWLGLALGRGLGRLGLGIGRALTWLLLGAAWWLVFTPSGLLLRVFGKDRLDTSFPGPPGSCWRPRAPADPARLRRQF